MNQTLKISIARGGCRFASPLYLGSSYVLSFEGARSDEAKRIILVKPSSQNHYDTDGFIALAESFVGQDGITLSLNRNALVEWFKYNGALDIDSYVDAHCYVFNGQGDIIADSPTTIEYSPTLFVIDYEDYPLAREVLLQATSSKEQAITAKEQAITAKEQAIVAMTAAELAKLKAENAKTAAEKASGDAIIAAEASSIAREDAITAKNEAQSAKKSAEESASTAETALGKMIASAKKVVGGVEVLLWNGQGNKPVPIFIPNGVDGVTGYVKCDEDGKYYCLKCKVVDGEKVLVLEQVGVDSVEGYVRSVNGIVADDAGDVKIPLDFLPLTGGKLSGSINISSDTYASLTLQQKDVVRGDVPNDKRHPSDIGFLDKNGSRIGYVGSSVEMNGDIAMQIVAYNPNQEISGYEGIKLVLIYKKNGTKYMALDGKKVAVDGDYLPLSGGIITGNISFSNETGMISNKNGVGRILITGGSDETAGATIFVMHKDNAGTYKGGVWIRTVSENNEFKSLLMLPSGVLEWDGKNVVRSVNGTEANADGNVSIPEIIKLLESSYSYDTEGTMMLLGDQSGGNFVIQSGVVYDIDSTSVVTVTFDVPFRDTNYVVICQQIRPAAGTGGIAVTSKSTTGFTLDVSSNDNDVMWFAFGFPNYSTD